MDPVNSSNNQPTFPKVAVGITRNARKLKIALGGIPVAVISLIENIRHSKLLTDLTDRQEQVAQFERTKPGVYKQYLPKTPYPSTQEETESQVS